MYSLSKNKNNYKIMRKKKRKTRGWIISSKSYMALEEIAKNLRNNIPKIYLKQIDLSITSSSMESNEDIDANLLRNIEKSNQPNISEISLEKSNQQDIQLSISEISPEKSNQDIQPNISEISPEKSNHQDIQPNISEISPEKNNQQVHFLDVQPSISQTNLFEILNDKTIDNTDLNINFSMNEDISLEHILNSSFTTLVEINAQYKEVTEIINDSNGINSNVAEDNIQNKTLKLCQITTVNQQDNIYEDSEDYNNDPDYDVSNDSDDESNISISESFDKNEKSNTTNDSLNTSKYEEKANCDDTNLIVLKSQEKGQNKKYFCKYCKKLQTKFARHLETVHKNEEEVKKFILLPKGNSERKAIIETIRKESNFIYNTSSQFNTGELIVSRRPSKINKLASEYICCPKCKGFYTKNNVRHHFQNCNKRSIGRHVMVLGRKVQARIHTKASDMVRKVIFPIMRDDNVCRIIRYDELVILRANKLCNKFRNQRHHDMIRAELRLLGRYLISIKKFNSNITNFASIYQPCNYDSCILAAKDVAQFNPDTNKFKTPSVATRLGTLLKKLGNILCTEYIKKMIMRV